MLPVGPDLLGRHPRARQDPVWTSPRTAPARLRQGLIQGQPHVAEGLPWPKRREPSYKGLGCRHHPTVWLVQRFEPYPKAWALCRTTRAGGMSALSCEPKHCTSGHETFVYKSRARSTIYIYIIHTCTYIATAEPKVFDPKTGGVNGWPSLRSGSSRRLEAESTGPVKT